MLSNSIEYLKGVGPQKAQTLQSEAGIFVYNDLLNYFPFRYVDRSKFFKINEIDSDAAYVQAKGVIGKVELINMTRGQRMVAEFFDDTGSIELVWFKGIQFLRTQIVTGKAFIAFGKPNFFKGKKSIPHPELTDPLDPKYQIDNSLQPIYPSTEKLTKKGLHTKGFENLVRVLLPLLTGKIKECFPQKIISQYGLLNREEAFFNIHLPQTQELLQKALFRLKFEELFFIQMQLLRIKAGRENTIKGNIFKTVGSVFNEFYSNYLPFPLTNAQKRVLKEIRKDVGSGKQMNRLLQGDVGSGKTIVGLLSILIGIDNGFQAAFMAPTEILAQQHFQGISEYLENTQINVALLTGSTKVAARREIHQQLENGELHILIGTHALIEDKVKFKNLGMVIIDEQHRFGVAQRAKLWKKNAIPPHVLVMTATPIPRTLAMTLYGDLDVSIIDELPPGRKSIKTIHKFDANRLRVNGFIKEEIEKGRQVYIVYPLIEESEKLDYKDLMDGYESICRAFPMPTYNVSIVHGRMKPKDKEFEMNRFVKGETQIMVATTVIEVGVNVPNASIMIIESAERFGLSQLHQLRGRVGRGAEQSYCVLITSFKLSKEAKLRMETMVRTNNGFEIADVDLKLRGPGDIMGTRQSGILDLKIADLGKDGRILQLARQVAFEVLNEDYNLQKPENLLLREHFKSFIKGRPNWSKIS